MCGHSDAVFHEIYKLLYKHSLYIFLRVTAVFFFAVSASKLAGTSLLKIIYFSRNIDFFSFKLDLK